MQNKKFFSSTRIVMIALFGGLAGILHILKFPLSFAFPSFLEFDFSDIPLFVGTFALGPLSGCLIVVIKLLVKLVFAGTGNLFVGELANLLIGCAFVIPAGLIYKHRRTMGGAVLALAVGSLSSVAVAILANRFLLIPFFVQLYGGWENILPALTKLFPSITRENFYTFYLWASVLPFNLLRCLVASICSLLVYKHISRLIDRMNRRLSPEGAKTGKGGIAAISLCIAAVVLLAVFALLRYFLWS